MTENQQPNPEQGVKQPELAKVGDRIFVKRTSGDFSPATVLPGNQVLLDYDDEGKPITKPVSEHTLSPAGQEKIVAEMEAKWRAENGLENNTSAEPVETEQADPNSLAARLGYVPSRTEATKQDVGVAELLGHVKAETGERLSARDDTAEELGEEALEAVGMDHPATDNNETTREEEVGPRPFFERDVMEFSDGQVAGLEVAESLSRDEYRAVDEIESIIRRAKAETEDAERRQRIIEEDLGSAVEELKNVQDMMRVNLSESQGKVEAFRSALKEADEGGSLSIYIKDKKLPAIEDLLDTYSRSGQNLMNSLADRVDDTTRLASSAAEYNADDSEYHLSIMLQQTSAIKDTLDGDQDRMVSAGEDAAQFRTLVED